MHKTLKDNEKLFIRCESLVACDIHVNISLTLYGQCQMDQQLETINTAMQQTAFHNHHNNNNDNNNDNGNGNGNGNGELLNGNENNHLNNNDSENSGVSDEMWEDLNHCVLMLECIEPGKVYFSTGSNDVLSHCIGRDRYGFELAQWLDQFNPPLYKMF